MLSAHLVVSARIMDLRNLVTVLAWGYFYIFQCRFFYQYQMQHTRARAHTHTHTHTHSDGDQLMNGPTAAVVIFFLLMCVKRLLLSLTPLLRYDTCAWLRLDFGDLLLLVPVSHIGVG